MSSEGKRQEVIALVNAKTFRQSEAATVLGISVRQVKRLCRAEREHGAIGLISKRRGPQLLIVLQMLPSSKSLLSPRVSMWISDQPSWVKN